MRNLEEERIRKEEIKKILAEVDKSGERIIRFVDFYIYNDTKNV